MRIAITGAGGQVGSQLTAGLGACKPAVEVIAVCRNAFSAKRLSAGRCEVRIGSLLDPDSARRVLEGCDTVIQSALSWENLGRPDSVNLQMIRAIARAGVKRMVLLSTVAVYSSCIQSGINTYTDPRPDSEYGRDKVICEREVIRLFSEPGHKGFVLRLGHVYGPSLLWSRRILNMACDRRFKLPFDGGLSSNAVRIDRLSAALAALLETDLAGGLFNLTDEPNRAWREVFDWHTRACGLPAVASLDELESRELRANYISLKRMGFVHASGEIARALVGAAGQMTTASQLFKEAGRALLGWMPARAEQVLRRRHLASVVRRELDAVAGPELWDPSLAILFSDPAPGPGLPATPQTPTTALAEQDLVEKLSSWYSQWSTPDNFWRQQR